MTKKPFIFATPPVQLDVDKTATTSIVVTTEATFYCEEIRVEGGGKYLDGKDAPCAILIRDSGEAWFNTFVHKNLVNGWKPTISRRILPGTTVTVEILNLASKPNEIRVSLLGYKNELEAA